MRYNPDRLEITVVINENVVLFRDIKISLGLLITVSQSPTLRPRRGRRKRVMPANRALANCAWG